MQASRRVGEADEATITDLALVLNTGLIKTALASRTDRIAKCNQLLRIEEILGYSVRYLGNDYKYAR